MDSCQILNLDGLTLVAKKPRRHSWGPSDQLHMISRHRLSDHRSSAHSFSFLIFASSSGLEAQVSHRVIQGDMPQVFCDVKIFLIS